MSSIEKVEDGDFLVLQGDEKGSTKESEPSPQILPAQSLQQKEDDCLRTVHGFKWLMVCVSIYIAALIYGLDSTIAADIQPAIVKQFDSVERLTWVGTGFPLGSVCAVLPTYGADLR
jgi:hypothetical protein